MPVFTSSIEVTADYPTIKPSLNLNFARSRSLDPRITFTRASVGTYVGRDGLVKTAGEDEARFDHDPVTLESLGLLIEESRTNLIATNIDNWGVNNTIKNTNAGIAPDGTNTANKFIRGPVATYQNINSSVSNVPTGVPLIMSWYLKAQESDTIFFQTYDGNWINATFDISAGGIVGSGGNIDDSGMYAVGNDWYRCWVKFDSASNALNLTFHPNTSSPVSGNSIDGTLIWGVQLEAGAFPTSYIPTSGSAVTRAKDVATITGTNFTNFYNTSEGTLYSSFIRNLQTNGFLVGLGYDGSNYIGMGYTADVGNNDVYIQPLVGSIFGHPSVGGNVKVKSIVSYSSSGASGCINGNTVVSETASGGLPSGSNGALYIGTSAYDPPTIGTGLISSVVYYPQRLTDAQLQLLTS